MQDFNLQLQFTISGIGATSGLVLIGNSLFIISDNSSFLYEYLISEKIVNKIRLQQNSEENSPKKNKSDLESITKNGNKLYLFGSGSTQNRNQRFSYHLKTKIVKHKNISKIYNKLSTKLSENQLNIEGAFNYDKKLYLFQRGNGENSQNGIFIIDENKAVSFTKIALPKVQNIEATFTDAILINDKIYFLAAVENTNSTYNDGEILGSFIGCLSIADFKLEFYTKISETQKFEGLTLFNQSKNQISFLLCEDNDTEELKSDIFCLTLN